MVPSCTASAGRGRARSGVIDAIAKMLKGGITSTSAEFKKDLTSPRLGAKNSTVEFLKAGKGADYDR